MSETTTAATTQRYQAGEAIDALVGAWAEAAKSAAERLRSETEAAAERARLDIEVERIKGRMQAFADVLTTIGEQKAKLTELAERAATPALADLYRRQVEMLTVQEEAVLARCVPQSGTEPQRLYTREGSRFVLADASGGAGAS